MKVAIIGAGVSGLACAYELERYGIIPDIFEQRPRSGELFTHSAVLLQIMQRPAKDPVADLKQNFNVIIKPLNTLKKITMKSAKAKGSVCGNLGYFVLLGQSEESITGQLKKKIKSPVRYNFRADYSVLAGEYDYVIVAAGTNDITRALGCWDEIKANWVMGATVLDAFDPSAMMMWINTRYTGSGYAYLTPLDSKSASLVLVVPEIAKSKLDSYWKKFWQVENLKHDIASQWSLQHVTGFVYPHQVGNILFVGNSGGFLEPFLGFALVKAVQSGIYAARSIAEGKRYEDFLGNFNKRSRYSIALRKQLDRFKDKDYDLLINVLTTPVIKQLIYNTNLDVVRFTASYFEVRNRLRSVSAKKIKKKYR